MRTIRGVSCTLICCLAATGCSGNIPTQPRIELAQVESPPCASPAPLTLAPDSLAIADQYMVFFTQAVSDPIRRTDELAAKYGLRVIFRYAATPGDPSAPPSGFAAAASFAAIQNIRCESGIAFVEQDARAFYDTP